MEGGTTLVRHGEVGTHCYAILQGEVVVTATTIQGTTVVLGRRGPGSVIGELAALDAEPRSATVTADGPVEAVALSADAFESLLRERPELAIAEIRRLGRQLRVLSERYVIRGEELRTRVVGLLLTNLDETGETTLRSTRQELADWIGATREAVTRALRRLEDAGLITLGRGTVTVVDRPSLDRLRTG